MPVPVHRWRSGWPCGWQSFSFFGCNRQCNCERLHRNRLATGGNAAHQFAGFFRIFSLYLANRSFHAVPVHFHSCGHPMRYKRLPECQMEDNPSRLPCGSRDFLVSQRRAHVPCSVRPCSGNLCRSRSCSKSVSGCRNFCAATIAASTAFTS